MKITLEATSTVDTIDGKVQARIWTGATETGVPVKAWIALIQPQTHDETALSEFGRELGAVPASRELVSFDIRMIL
jgi:hypothetical protein